MGRLQGEQGLVKRVQLRVETALDCDLIKLRKNFRGKDFHILGTFIFEKKRVFLIF